MLLNLLINHYLSTSFIGFNWVFVFLDIYYLKCCLIGLNPKIRV